MAIRSVYSIRQLMNGIPQNGSPILSCRGHASGSFTLKRGCSLANGTGEEFIRIDCGQIKTSGPSSMTEGLPDQRLFELPSLDEASNLKTEFPELLQSFCVAFSIVHWIVAMHSDSIFLPLRRFGSILDQAGVKIADSPA